MFSRLPVLAFTLAALGCGADGTGPEKPDGSLRILWPAENVAIADSAMMAVAIVRGQEAGADSPELHASLDGSRQIAGVRQDSFVTFELDVPSDGRHELAVRTSTGLVAERTFRREYEPRPRVHAVEVGPAPGYSDRQVTIRGARFGSHPRNVRVFLNGAALPVYLVWPDSIYARIPTDHDARDGLITVAISGRLSPDRTAIDLQEPGDSGAPVIWMVFPNDLANPGSPVGITGRSFTRGATVYFGETPAPSSLRFQDVELPGLGAAAEIVVLVPPDMPSGTHSVHVVEGGVRSNSIRIALP